MSATPVINNLQEARKLLEVVTGHKHTELGTRPTVNNALAVHRSLMVNGFRYRPRYELEIRTETVEVMRNDFLPDLLAARGVLGLEQALLPAKLDAVISYVRRGTVIYTHAGGIDQPLSAIKDGVAIMPHANWRGQYAVGTGESGQALWTGGCRRPGRGKGRCHGGCSK